MFGSNRGGSSRGFYRSAGPQREDHRPDHQAYVLPYRKTAEGTYQILVGEKRVTNYKGIAELRQNIIKDKPAWGAVMQCLRRYINPLNARGKVVDSTGRYIGSIRPRFTGCLSPAGGKKCFFGGGQKTEKETVKETPKETAKRELLEELGLDKNLRIDDAHLILVKQYSLGRDGWNGYYYCLDIEKCPALMQALDIQKEKERILKMERECSISEVYSNPEKHPDVEKYPELHHLEYVNQEDLLAHLKFFDENYVREQLMEFVTLFVEALKSELKDTSQIDATKLVDQLAIHFRDNEKTDGNDSAAEALLRLISETVVPRQGKMGGP